MAFTSGLMQRSGHTLAQAGWLVPCQFGASFVICPAPSSTESERKRLNVRRIYLTTTPEDVYIDERVVAVLADPQGTLDSDPYGFCRRAPGVYALYRVAKHYYAAIKADRTKFVEAERLIINLLSELGETRARHVADNPRCYAIPGSFQYQGYFVML